MISVNDLTHVYPGAGQPAVSGASFEVSPGEIFGLLGPSGAGKSLALLIPTVADDKVGALAVFKGASFVTLAPLALFFIPTEAWYQPVLLISPTGWVMKGYRAFLDPGGLSGYLWAWGGVAYGVGLFAVVVRLFRRKSYGG